MPASANSSKTIAQVRSFIRLLLYTLTMSKQFLGVLAAIVIVLVGVFALTGNKSNDSKGSSSAKPTNHITGQGKANVTLVEYGDYECPFCGQAYPIVKQVVSDLNQQIFFQFRNFPLVSLHKNAFSGAR